MLCVTVYSCMHVMCDSVSIYIILVRSGMFIPVQCIMHNMYSTFTGHCENMMPINSNDMN